MKTYLKILIFSLFFLYPNVQTKAAENINSFYEKAAVVSVKDIVKEINGENGQGEGRQVISSQEIKIKILSGELKNEEKILENNLSLNPLDIKLKEGDKILVYIEGNKEQGYSFQIQSYYVLSNIIILILLFFLSILIIGWLQGLKAIISLSLSVFLIFKLFIPRAIAGTSPIALSLAVSTVIALITFLLISGRTKKTLAALLGTVGGVVIAALIAMFFGNLTHLTGLADENARTLFSNFPNLNFKGLLFAGIIIGALGAVMDIAMSIASTITEIKKASPNIKRKELIMAGINVGRDVMGTMSNTLIFAYVGSSLFLLMLFSNESESYIKFLNFNFVTEEIIRSIAGSIGLILAIPLTAIIAGYLEDKK